MRPEQRFYNQLSDYMCFPGDVSRMENMADSGTPDVSGEYNGLDYWVELKVAETKKPQSPDAILRSSQIIWHLRRKGSVILVLTKYPDKLVLHKFVDGVYTAVAILPRQGAAYPWADLRHTIMTEIITAMKERTTKWSTLFKR